MSDAQLIVLQFFDKTKCCIKIILIKLLFFRSLDEIGDTFPQLKLSKN